jgi:hypothetical protein
LWYKANSLIVLLNLVGVSKQIQGRSEVFMYIYYILRGNKEGTAVELEGDIDEASFPGIDLDNGPAIIDSLVQKINQESSSAYSWEECDLTDSFFNREDTYLFYNDRWMRRSDTPWRKDKGV